MLTPDQAVGLGSQLHDVQVRERYELDVFRRYVTGKQGMPMVIPRDAPAEVKEMARISRINVISIVVNSLVESLFVDNLRTTVRPDAADGTPGDAENVTVPVWDAWQANRLDKRQSGLYRAVFTYGYGYMVYTQGAPFPVIRPMSPRQMTAMYGEDDDWPDYALERRRRPGTFRLYDEGHVYNLGYDEEKKMFTVLGVPAEHGSDHCPVVRYCDIEDLDVEDEPEPHVTRGGPRGDFTDMVAGQVAPLMTLQDQTDVTTFSLKSAEWYAAFRQRWVVGWTPSSASEKVKSAASQMWTFDADPDEVKIGEFSQTTLDGYLASRDSTAKFVATLSQTPVHELIGELVNLSAEALAAAEAGRDRKIDERKTGLGESHEQLSQGVGDLMGVNVPDDLEVVWRDTSARAFGAIVDGLGKLAAQLQIPPDQLWDRIPGVTLQDVKRWRQARDAGDSIENLTGMLDRQANSVPSGQPGGSPLIVARPGQRA
jgi:hypothetical protein